MHGCDEDEVNPASPRRGVTPHEMYDSDAEFRALVDRVSGAICESTEVVLSNLTEQMYAPGSGPYLVRNYSGQLPSGLSTDAAYWIKETTSADMIARVRDELSNLDAKKAEDHAMAPDHRPGARRPGHKATPPVPRWARKRR